MATHTIREVQAPYTVNPDDEAVGRDTIIIHRDGEPVAAVIPYPEYQEWLATRLATPLESPRPPIPDDPEFERNRAAFYRLLPALLSERKGQWVAIVDEQVAAAGPTASAVLNEVYERRGNVRMYVQEILEQPRIYQMPGRRVIGVGRPEHTA